MFFFPTTTSANHIRARENFRNALRFSRSKLLQLKISTFYMSCGHPGSICSILKLRICKDLWFSVLQAPACDNSELGKSSVSLPIPTALTSLLGSELAETRHSAPQRTVKTFLGASRCVKVSEILQSSALKVTAKVYVLDSFFRFLGMRQEVVIISQLGKLEQFEIRLYWSSKKSTLDIWWPIAMFEYIASIFPPFVLVFGLCVICCAHFATPQCCIIRFLFVLNLLSAQFTFIALKMYL